jgi:hypothetical protein
LRRFGGDEERAAKAYEGVTPLVAEVIRFVTSARHVDSRSQCRPDSVAAHI